MKSESVPKGWKNTTEKRAALRTNTRPFTLLEMLIVLLILSSVVGVVAVNIRNLILQQRFRSEVTLVVDTLRTAQDLMLILDNDTHVKFAEDKNKAIKMWIETEAALTKGWETQILRSRKKLSAIHSVNFNDELEGPEEAGVLDIRFLSGGSHMSKGTMYLSTAEELDQKNALLSVICLPGYPSPIKSVSLKEGCEDDTTDYDERITALTKQNVQQKEEEDEEEK